MVFTQTTLIKGFYHLQFSIDAIKINVINFGLIACRNLPYFPFPGFLFYSINTAQIWMKVMEVDYTLD